MPAPRAATRSVTLGNQFVAAKRSALAGDTTRSMNFVFGFAALRALSPRPAVRLMPGGTVWRWVKARRCSPWRASSARAGGCRHPGRLIGYATGHGPTPPHPATSPRKDRTRGHDSRRCSAAGVAPEDIDYLNAHGTGTRSTTSQRPSPISHWAGPRRDLASQFHQSRHRTPPGWRRRRRGGRFASWPCANDGYPRKPSSRPPTRPAASPYTCPGTHR